MLVLPHNAACHGKLLGGGKRGEGRDRVPPTRFNRSTWPESGAHRELLEFLDEIHLDHGVARCAAWGRQCTCRRAGCTTGSGPSRSGSRRPRPPRSSTLSPTAAGPTPSGTAPSSVTGPPGASG